MSFCDLYLRDMAEKEVDMAKGTPVRNMSFCVFIGCNGGGCNVDLMVESMEGGMGIPEILGVEDADDWQF